MTVPAHNGEQPAALPLEGTPPIGEVLNLMTMQVETAEGIFVLLRLTGPGKVWSGFLGGEDAVNWGNQIVAVGQLTKAGLIGGKG